MTRPMKMQPITERAEKPSVKSTGRFQKRPVAGKFQILLHAPSFVGPSSGPPGDTSRSTDSTFSPPFA